MPIQIMKRSATLALGSIIAFSLIFMVKQSSAGVSVEISGNRDGSTSRVQVNNNVESSSNGESTSNTKTDIRIESNGEVKEYHSEDGGSVTLESSDGKSKVNINNQTNPSNTTSQSSSSSVKTDIKVNNNNSTNSSDIEGEVKEKMKEVEDLKLVILEFIKDKLSFFPLNLIFASF